MVGPFNVEVSLIIGFNSDLAFDAIVIPWRRVSCYLHLWAHGPDCRLRVLRGRVHHWNLELITMRRTYASRY